MNKTLQTKKKCYYCEATEKLEVDYLPNGHYVRFCPFHFSWNNFSKQNKKLSSEDFRKYFMPGLVTLLKKRFKPWGKQEGSE